SCRTWPETGARRKYPYCLSRQRYRRSWALIVILALTAAVALPSSAPAAVSHPALPLYRARPCARSLSTPVPCRPLAHPLNPALDLAHLRHHVSPPHALAAPLSPSFLPWPAAPRSS
ncbi:hypothetical protein FS749_015140, partial [Ceratobasidium sp. UAMH 11750]